MRGDVKGRDLEGNWNGDEREREKNEVLEMKEEYGVEEETRRDDNYKIRERMGR